MRSLRRHRRLGASIALLALVTFVGASVADARGLDPCPHHDAVNLAKYGAAAQGGHGRAMAHMGHGQGADRSHHRDQHEHGPCNCVGSCDSGGAPPMVAAAPNVTRAVAATSAITPPAAPTNLVPTQDDGWTPYLPQAPPLSV